MHRFDFANGHLQIGDILFDGFDLSMNNVDKSQRLEYYNGH